MLGALLISIYVFVLSMFVGFEVIGKIAPTLHNPLLAALSAVGGILLIGALYGAAAASASAGPGSWFATGAAALAVANGVGGFILISRMLGSSKKRERT
jgi:H+-translocating NAD(P) transhydrogenase subunit alpha